MARAGGGRGYTRPCGLARRAAVDCSWRLTAARGALSIAAMADVPRLTRAKAMEHAARDERLARSLRENLRRRKEQARAREAQAGDPADKAAGGDEPPA
jgi:hypothetical protein